MSVTEIFFWLVMAVLCVAPLAFVAAPFFAKTPEDHPTQNQLFESVIWKKRLLIILFILFGGLVPIIYGVGGNPSLVEPPPTLQQETESQEDARAMGKRMTAQLQQRLEKEGGSAEEWQKLAKSLVVLQQPEAAMAVLDKALGHFPENLDLLTNFLENSYMLETEIPDKTAAIATKLLQIKTEPSSPYYLAHYLLGLYACQHHQKAEAEIHWQKLPDNFPQQPHCP
ncbi:MAG: tetratricopeptide repeat protein [Alphaproteobacteria bacterium]